MKIALCVAMLFGTAVFAQVEAGQESMIRIVRTDQELRQSLKSVEPGVVIRIAPGRYAGGHSVSGWQGTSGQPIRIEALDPNEPPVIEGGGNAFHLSEVAYVTIDSLVISGSQANGLNIDDGGKNDRPSHHVVLKNLTIRSVGSNGNQDGIKLSGLTDFEVENCRLTNWGRGGSGIDMVGCHRGVIRSCRFQGREDDAGNGVQTKGGSSEIRIQGCRFEQVGNRGVNLGGSTGLQFFRPIDAAFEARDITLEDCVFLGSPAPIAFVGVDGATARHNTIYLPGKYVARILQENSAERFARCRDGSIENNLIVFDPSQIGSTTNVGPNTMPETFVYRNNAWHSLDGRGRKPRHDIREENGIYDKSPIFLDAKSGDLRQTDDSPTKSYGSRSASALMPAQ